MSTEISSESKTVTETKNERTWRVTIETPRGTDYKIKAHRQVEVLEDDVFDHFEDAELKEIEESMTNIVAMDDTVSYKDKTGTGKTVPIADLPFLVPEAIEILVAKKKAEV